MSNAGQDMEQLQFSHIASGMQSIIATLENSLAVSYKVIHVLTI